MPTLIDPATGRAYDVPDEQVGVYLRQGFTPEGAEQRSGRIAEEARQEAYGGVGGKVVAGAAGLARGLTVGGSDLALRAIEGDDAAYASRNYRDVNPGVSTAGELVGAVAPALVSGGAALPAGLAARAGSAVAELGEGGGALARLGSAALGGATEGAIYGAGQGVSQLALSEDPLNLETAGSVLSSSALLGAAFGGGAGVLGKAAEAGLSLAAERATSALSSRALLAGERTGAEAAGAELAGEVGAGRAASGFEREVGRANAAIGEAREANAIAPDLVGLDAKALRAAEDSEVAAIKESRVPLRAQLADEITAFRAQAIEDKLQLTTSGIRTDRINVLGKRALKADQALDRLIDNPIRLAQEPERALAALQQQDAAFEAILGKQDTLRKIYATDESGVRAATLDKIPAALQKNRELQARIAELTAAPSSERLEAIRDARALLSTPKPAAPPPSAAEQILSGTVFGGITGLVHSIPVIGQIPGLAQIAGVKGAKLATSLVFGSLKGTTAELAARGARAAEAAASVAKRVASGPAPVLASATLSRVRFGEPSAEPVIRPSAGAPPLAAAFHARAAELRAQTRYNEAGNVEIRPEARARIAATFDAIRAVSPILADRMETVAVRRIEYLSSALPRRPDVGGVPIGPDRWQPSDLETRSWARKVAAVEDPHAALERVAAGIASPEDAEALRAVYPELVAQFTHDVMAQLPTLSRTLPYRQRLALSIFTGQPVEPSLHPKVIRALQAQYAAEPGSQGGTAAPTAQPQFGAIKKSLDAPTPSQGRSQ